MRNSGQIWVETVIYTLIGLSIIAVVLSLVLPQIEEKKDALIIEQSYNMLSEINNQVEYLRTRGEANSQPFEIKLNRGKIVIDGENDTINFELDSKSKYSEPGKNIAMGVVQALTTEKKNGYLVELTLGYNGKINITWEGEDKVKEIQASSVPYELYITNQGASSGVVNMDFRNA